MKNRSLSALAAIAYALSGCAFEVIDEDEARRLEQEAEAEVASQALPIKAGTPDHYAQRGLVEVISPTGVVCSGALINQSWVVTSATCVGRYLDGDDGPIDADVYYFDRDTQVRRKISFETMMGHIPPALDCTLGWANCKDFDDDIAILQHGVPNAVPWSGAEPGHPWFTVIDSADYLRLNGGTSSGSISDIGTLTMYGSGAAATNGAGAGVYRRTTISVNSSGAKWLRFTAGTHGPCSGDQGAPILGNTSEHRVLAGLFSTASWADQHCAADNAQLHGPRINFHLDWMLDFIPGCTQFSHYTKCF